MMFGIDTPKEVAQVFSIVAGSVSAIAWLVASLMATPVPMAYLDGPPSNIMARIRRQSIANGVAACFAAVAVAAQAWITWTEL